MQYFKIEGAPGPYFRCEPYGATMSVSGCAGMFTAEKGNRSGGRHQHCYGCDVGSEHAGEQTKKSAAVFGSKMCPRCAKSGSRIVRGLCVSCLNRQYEIEKGRNAKGAPPVKLAALHSCLVAFSVDHKVSVVTFEQTVSRIEGIYRILRTKPGQPVFGWARPRPVTSQRSIFD